VFRQLESYESKFSPLAWLVVDVVCWPLLYLPLTMEAAFVRDEAFLLRCASTFNWDPLLERCRKIHEIFSSESNNLQVAASLHQLQAMDEWQNTPLHLTCFHGAPLEVINALMEAASAADPPMQVTSFLTGDNSTPLLIACATGASAETINALLNPPSNQLTHGGFHAGFPDDQGATPLSEVWKRFDYKRTRQMHNWGTEKVRYEEQLWTNVEAILNAGWRLYAERGEKTPSMVHSAAYLAESCPVALTDAIFDRHHDSITVRDHRRMLPLHIAICTPSSHRHQVLKENRAHVIHRLLELYPNAARMSLPGKRPRSPFCTAIASGLDWHVAGSSSGPLLKLWQCAPEAIASRDMETGLYPFLLAATIETRQENDADKVNTIFNILRLYPQAVQDMLSTVI
jgi:ankyrin repeat protein